MKLSVFSFCFLLLISNLFSQQTFQSYFGEDIPFTESYGIINTSDGGFLVTGAITQIGTLNIDFYVIKLDKNGVEKWSFIHDVDFGTLGDLALDGLEFEDSYLISALGWKINEAALPYPLFLHLDKETGELLDCHYANDSSIWYSEVLKNDNSVIATFYEKVNDSLPNHPVMSLAKISDDGNIIWEKSYLEETVTSGNNPEEGGLFIDENDFCYIAGGGAFSLAEESRLTLTKTDEEGNLQWVISIDSTDRASSICNQSDGLVVSSNHSKGTRAHLFKFDFEGNLIWEKGYGANFTRLSTCVSNEEDELFAVGDKDHKLVLAKMDATGEILWIKEVVPKGNIDLYRARDMVLTSDGGLAITGFINTAINGGDTPTGIFVYRVNAEGEFGPILNTNSSVFDLHIAINPNPTKDIVSLRRGRNNEEYSIMLYDMEGKLLYFKQWSSEIHQINLSKYPAATYILQLSNTKNQRYQKLIVKQ